MATGEILYRATDRLRNKMDPLRRTSTSSRYPSYHRPNAVAISAAIGSETTSRVLLTWCRCELFIYAMIKELDVQETDIPEDMQARAAEGAPRQTGESIVLELN